MADSLTYLGVEFEQGQLNVQFRHTSWGGKRTCVRVIPLPECKEGFFPWSDCYIDESSYDDNKFVFGQDDNSGIMSDLITWRWTFKIEKLSIKEDGDCIKIKYKWSMWYGIIPIPGASVSVGTVIGGAEAAAGIMPKSSGEFMIKVCCDDDCKPKITVLQPPVTASGSGSESESDGNN